MTTPLILALRRQRRFKATMVYIACQSSQGYTLRPCHTHTKKGMEGRKEGERKEEKTERERERVSLTGSSIHE